MLSSLFGNPEQIEQARSHGFFGSVKKLVSWGFSGSESASSVSVSSTSQTLAQTGHTAVQTSSSSLMGQSPAGSSALVAQNPVTSSPASVGSSALVTQNPVASSSAGSTALVAQSNMASQASWYGYITGAATTFVQGVNGLGMTYVPAATSAFKSYLLAPAAAVVGIEMTTLAVAGVFAVGAVGATYLGYKGYQAYKAYSNKEAILDNAKKIVAENMSRKKSNVLEPTRSGLIRDLKKAQAEIKSLKKSKESNNLIGVGEEGTIVYSKNQSKPGPQKVSKLEGIKIKLEAGRHKVINGIQGLSDEDRIKMLNDTKVDFLKIAKKSPQEFFKLCEISTEDFLFYQQKQKEKMASAHKKSALK